MSEIKSYKLADDGNMVTIMMKDGTVHNSLIFLDDGKLCTRSATKLKQDAYPSSSRTFSSITFLLCFTAFPFEIANTYKLIIQSILFQALRSSFLSSGVMQVSGSPHQMTISLCLLTKRLH